MQLKRPLCVAVLLLCTGLFLVQLTGQKMAEALPKEKEQISLGGRLMQKEEKNGHLLLYLQQVQILSGAVAADASNTNNKNSNRKMGAVCYLQEGSLVQAPSLGSRVVVCGRVMYFAHAENEGQFDARAYYASLGYDFQLTNAELLKFSREADRLAEGLFRLREDAKAFFKAYMREENAGILSAMVLGEKSALDGDIRMLFQRNGIAHILAISGVKTLKLDIPLVPETRINWAFVPLHIAIIYILKLCLDEEIIPRCRFPCSRGYLTKYINWQKKQ